MKSVNAILNTVVVTFDTASAVIKDSGVVLTQTAGGLANLATAGNVASQKLLEEQAADLENARAEMKYRVAEHATEIALKLSESQQRLKEAMKSNPEIAKLLPQTLAFLGITENSATTK